MISIHVPREGHDVEIYIFGDVADEFQSTCPARGTTAMSTIWGADAGISIHVPREGHDLPAASRRAAPLYFNPRAPRGARREDFIGRGVADEFQSTCPARGTTHRYQQRQRGNMISIHVPREGHDMVHPGAARP